jgi:pilus assembly protein Flp/PilA
MIGIVDQVYYSNFRLTGNRRLTNNSGIVVESAAKRPDLLPVKCPRLGFPAVHESRNAKRILTWTSAERELKLERQMNKLMRFVKDESGVTAIEYGLIAAATGLVLVAVMPDLKLALSGIFNKINSGLNSTP